MRESPNSKRFSQESVELLFRRLGIRPRVLSVLRERFKDVSVSTIRKARVRSTGRRLHSYPQLSPLPGGGDSHPLFSRCTGALPTGSTGPQRSPILALQVSH